MLQLGRPAPDFTLPAADGSRGSLRALRGRPVLLVFMRHLT
jgi:peroxiredoxin